MQVSTGEKIIGVALYMYVIKSSMPFGRLLLIKLGLLNYINYFLLPIHILEHSLPLNNFFIFLILILGIVRNPKISYFLRFNTLQVILLNIGSIIISYLLSLYQIIHAITILEIIYSFIFLSYLTISSYCIIRCIQGKEANLPTLSVAVRMQI